MTSNIEWILGNKVNDIKKGIVVKLSGGADSSIIYYALCKELSNLKLDIPVYAVTLGTQCKPVYPLLARKVIHFTGLNTGIWPKEHINYHEKRHTADLMRGVGTPEYYRADIIYTTMQDFIWWDLFIDNKADALLGGLTQNPNKEKMRLYLHSVANKLNLDIENINYRCEASKDPNREDHKNKRMK